MLNSENFTWWVTGRWQILSQISTSFEQVRSYSWTGESMLLILENENKNKGKQRGEKTPHLFFKSCFGFILHSGGGSGCYFHHSLGSLDLELFMCTTHFGIPAIFMKRSYRTTYLHNISLLDQHLTVAPVSCIILSAPSLSTSSGILPLSPESPTWPLFLLHLHTGVSGKERRMEQEGWGVVKRPAQYFPPSSLLSFV